MIEPEHSNISFLRDHIVEKFVALDSMSFVSVWPFVVLSFLLGTLKLLTYAHAVCGRPTLKDVVERLFWPGAVRKLKKSYIENKCLLNEQICENHDMNCLETKCQTREAQNCESVQEKKVAELKVSTIDGIESQRESTPSRMHLVKLLKKKVNFLSICIIIAFCFLLLLNSCIVSCCPSVAFENNGSKFE